MHNRVAESGGHRGHCPSEFKELKSDFKLEGKGGKEKKKRKRKMKKKKKRELDSNKRIAI